MDNEEFMYTLEKGDYKFICEYDTFEEYKEIHEMAQKDYQHFVNEKMKFEQVQKTLVNIHHKVEDEEYKITFSELEYLFIEDCKEEESVKKSSFKAYHGVFNKLKFFFEDKPITTITINDFKAFRRYLKTIITNRKAPLSNSTINEIMLYTNMFIEYAIANKHIKENNIKAIKNLKETSKTKDNFSDKQVLEIINSKEFDDKYIFCFKMMAYHGIRFNDLFNLQEAWKKEKDGVKYLDFDHGKTINAKRIVPIHPKMIDDVAKIKFSLFLDKSYNAGYKEAKKQIEKLYPPK